MARAAVFYMIHIVARAGVARESIERKMDLANDWYRLHDTLWIVYSTSDADRWYTRLKPLVRPGGFVFVCQLDTSARQGWMPKSFWKWLRREDRT